MVIAGYTQMQVTAKESCISDAKSLALKLMDVFFTKDEMASGNCTFVKGKNLLNLAIIDGIRSKNNLGRQYLFIFNALILHPIECTRTIVVCKKRMHIMCMKSYLCVHLPEIFIPVITFMFCLCIQSTLTMYTLCQKKKWQQGGTQSYIEN